MNSTDQSETGAPTVKPLTKDAALKIWGDAAELRYTSPVSEWLAVFPDRETLATFRAEVGSLSWGENYGQSPWDAAFSLAWDCGNGITKVTRNWISGQLDSETKWQRDEAVAHVNLLRLFRAPGLPEEIILKAGIRPLPESQIPTP